MSSQHFFLFSVLQAIYKIYSLSILHWGKSTEADVCGTSTFIPCSQRWFCQAYLCSFCDVHAHFLCCSEGSLIIFSMQSPGFGGLREVAELGATGKIALPEQPSKQTSLPIDYFFLKLSLGNNMNPKVACSVNTDWTSESPREGLLRGRLTL